MKPTKENLLKQASNILDHYLDGDPEKALTVIELAKAADNDPEKMLAVLAIARFLSGGD